MGDPEQLELDLRNNYDQYLVDTLSFSYFQQRVLKDREMVDKNIVDLAVEESADKDVVEVIEGALVVMALICDIKGLDLAEIANTTLKRLPDVR